MRNSVFSLLALAGLAFGQSYYETHASIRNTFSGGISLAVSEGSSNMNPGVSACIEPIKMINTYFGAGGHIDYTWLSMKNLDSAESRGGHFFDISFVPKAYLPISTNKCFSFEVDPGLYGVYAYFWWGGYKNSDFKLFFGLTSGVTFTIDAFSFIIKFKSIITEDNYVLRTRLVNWMSFCAGIAL